MNRSDQPIEALLDEGRLFPPPEGVAQSANMADSGIYQRAAKDPEAYWAQAAESLEWIRKWDRVLDWNPPIAQWFVGGKINVSVNCLDRHVRGWRRNKAAFIWEGEPGEERVLTYADLYREVNRFANAMKRLGVRKGDRVTIYMPMIPELPIALLACARIGAPHSVVFGGFSAESLRDRINDAQSKLVITADGSYRRGQIVPLKRNVDAAVKDCPCVEKVVMVRRIGEAAPVEVDETRDVWWHRAVEGVPAYCEPEPMDSEDPLFILYTSGTTAKPKGILHTTGGYLLGASLTHKWVFDAKEEDVYWCSADIGWVTGHSYIVYGPLTNGTTGVLYEGSPDWPDKDRWWAMVAKYGVNIFYTAPTAIRAVMKWGESFPAKHDLSSLRLLGTVGEPINPEAWMWYHQKIGQGRCPIVDTWWQTETGSIMISPLPGLTTTKPGSATFPLPGIQADVVDEAGRSVPLGEAATWSSNPPGPPWRAPSTETRRDMRRPIGGASARTSILPGMVASGTRTAISGCWAVWMTS